MNSREQESCVEQMLEWREKIPTDNCEELDWPSQLSMTGAQVQDASVQMPNDASIGLYQHGPEDFFFLISTKVLSTATLVRAARLTSLFF